MKHGWTIFLLLIALMPMATAQKYACVNTDYVLRSIPEYVEAQKKLDRLVEEWRKEMDEKVAELDHMRAEYEQESFLLPDNLKKRRLEDIKLKEQEIREFQQQRLGANGDLEKCRSELMRPVQDKVYSAIERIAHDKGYAFVFDKAGSATLLFVSKKYDISDEVLESLGYKPGTMKEDEVSEQQKTKGKNASSPVNPEMRVPLSSSK